MRDLGVLEPRGLRVGEKKTYQTNSTHVQGFFIGWKRGRECRAASWGGVRERDTGM